MKTIVLENLARLAQLIQQRNRLEEEITAVIGRPAQIGHLGEYMTPLQKGS